MMKSGMEQINNCEALILKIANLFNFISLSYLMKLKFGTNFAIFAIFFGMALVLALKNGNWIGALIFLIAGLISLWADNNKKKK